MAMQIYSVKFKPDFECYTATLKILLEWIIAMRIIMRYSYAQTKSNLKSDQFDIENLNWAPGVYLGSTPWWQSYVRIV